MPLTRAEIVAGARVLIERDGLDACSMRALAEHLDVQPPAIYRKVRDREDLLALVLDDVLGDLRLPTSGLWQRRLETTMRDLRARFAERPQLVSLLVHVRPEGRNGLRIVAAMGDTLREAGFTERAAAFAISALWTYTFGLTHVQLTTTWAHHDERPGSPLYEATLDVDGDAVFAFGLRQLLDGLEHAKRRVPTSTARRRTAPRR